MANKTTVDLTDVAKAVKDKYMPVYGLKNCLSAGLMLLGKLSTDQRENIILECTKPLTPDQQIDTLTDAVDIIKSQVRDAGGQVLIPGKKMQAAINKIRRELPTPAKSKQSQSQGG